MLQNETFVVAKIGFDTAENGPSKSWGNSNRPLPWVKCASIGADVDHAMQTLPSFQIVVDITVWGF